MNVHHLFKYSRFSCLNGLQFFIITKALRNTLDVSLLCMFLISPQEKLVEVEFWIKGDEYVFNFFS